jgi:hypothetical protein
VIEKEDNVKIDRVIEKNGKLALAATSQQAVRK